MIASVRGVRIHVVANLDQHPSLQRRLSRPRRNRVAVTVLVAVVVVLALRSSQSDSAPTPVAVVHGKEVKGQNALVLVDRSVSMKGTEAQVQSQLERLAHAGISIANRREIPGFAISSKSSESLLPVLKEAIGRDSHADVVYVISDFDRGDSDDNEPAACDGLVRILRDRHIRIYWATVKKDPIPTYYQIAQQSGGDVIPSN